jgi:hypothetical protein
VAIIIQHSPFKLTIRYDRIFTAAGYYYMNKRGELAIPEKFDLASHFFKGLAHVKIKSTTEKIIDFSKAKGSYAYIDVTGKKVFSYTNER